MVTKDTPLQNHEVEKEESRNPEPQDGNCPTITTKPKQTVKKTYFPDATEVCGMVTTSDSFHTVGRHNTILNEDEHRGAVSCKLQEQQPGDQTWLFTFAITKLIKSWNKLFSRNYLKGSKILTKKGKF